MKYLFLAYRDEKQLETISASARDTFERACLANNEALRENGHLIATETLQRSNTTTVQAHNGKVTVNDGPNAEPNARIATIFLIDARDLNEAIQVAAQMPQAHGGPIEVRPLMALPLNNHKENL